MADKLFSVLGINSNKKGTLAAYSKKVKIPLAVLEYYNSRNILPSSSDLEKITYYSGISALEIQLAMGIVDRHIKTYLATNYKAVAEQITTPTHQKKKDFEKVFETKSGKLYKGNCISLLKTIKDETFDLVFADPPFNLNKFYLSAIDDNLSNSEYIRWCEEWLDECIRTLKPGGSLFIWNLPKWNGYLSNYLNERLNFRHWIATDIKFSLPIQGKLYPSHYSLLYYVKGEKPNTFKPDRLPMEICKKCYNETKDYGGYKDKMNPKGINMTDVWNDIPPVRHRKYKKRAEANELSIKLLDRIIEMASNPGDVIFDPFGGSGTTYIVSEIKKRKWVGIELGPIKSIIDRFENIADEIAFLDTYRAQFNSLFSKEVKEKRKKRGLWTDDSFSNTSEPLVLQLNDTIEIPPQIKKRTNSKKAAG